MPRTSKKKPEYQTNGGAPKSGVSALIKELWQAAVNLRGSVEPADYKRYSLPIIFLRFLSLRFEACRAELDRLVKEPQSEYFDDRYDAVATNYLNLYNEAFLRDLIHDVVQTIKRNLKVDWTQSHCKDVKLAVWAAVRRVLRRRNVCE